MAILVTGGAGFIGSHTCVELLEHGEEVVVVDNYYNSKPEVMERVKQITGKDFAVYELDVMDKDGLNQVFEQHQIEAVIHFAGYKAVPESVAKPIMYYHNNITSTCILCEVMAAHGVKKLVFSSSATVYGVPKSVPITEDFPLATTNPYGTTKLMIEKILGDLQKSDEEWSIAVLRYFNPIGAHKSGLIGDDPNGIPLNLMPYITRVGAGILPKLNIYGNDYNTPDGTGVRDYIHVVDLSEGHVAAIDYLRKNQGIEYFNLGTGKGYSVLEIVHAYESATGISIPYEIGPRRAGDIDECYANPEKAARLLGWRAKKSLEEMCEDCARWQKSIK